MRGDRENRLKSQISLAIRTNCLTPADAIKLRGELGLYSSLLAEKLGRRTMGPLIRRQYRKRGFRLSRELRRNLLWRYSALGNLEPRTSPPNNWNQLDHIRTPKDMCKLQRPTTRHREITYASTYHSGSVTWRSQRKGDRPYSFTNFAHPF